MEALERRLAAIEPPALTPAQRAQMHADLSAAPAAIRLVHDGGSAHLKKFHRQLLDVLSESGWKTSGGIVLGNSFSSDSGLLLIKTADGVPGRDHFLAALKHADIPYDLGEPEHESFLDGDSPIVFAVVTGSLK